MDDKKTISELRKEIDGFDDKIVNLLLKRFALSKQIGIIKNSTGLTIHDPKRENEIINRLTTLLDGQIQKEDIASIFAPVYRVSKKFQIKK